VQRAIGAVCRSVAYNYAVSEDPTNFKKVVVDDELIRESLGNPKFDFKMNERITKPGIAIVRRYLYNILGTCLHRSGWESTPDRVH
jgi:ATP-dependent Lon protease